MSNEENRAVLSLELETPCAASGYEMGWLLGTLEVPWWLRLPSDPRRCRHGARGAQVSNEEDRAVLSLELRASWVASWHQPWGERLEGLQAFWGLQSRPSLEGLQAFWGLQARPSAS
jgi:hypothetical protein